MVAQQIELLVANTDTYYSKGGSCSHVGYEPQPWLAIDMGEAAASKVVGCVRIYNRGDCCAGAESPMICPIISIAMPAPWKALRPCSLAQLTKGIMLNRVFISQGRASSATCQEMLQGAAGCEQVSSRSSSTSRMCQHLVAPAAAPVSRRRIKGDQWGV